MKKINIVVLTLHNKIGNLTGSKELFLVYCRKTWSFYLVITLKKSPPFWNERQLQIEFFCDIDLYMNE